MCDQEMGEIAMKLAERYAEATLHSELRWVSRRREKWLVYENLRLTTDPEETIECYKFLEFRKLIEKHPKWKGLFKVKTLEQEDNPQ